ncbi:hypothetical protein SAMN05660297_00533 [Natronincola peptidivorans]|uniref:Uncharacterized protein n=1 Tax=Natronincola peptidivorans TaxID=426128 RepID=A0A1H9Z5B7_9FIRM|nr:hypothetical protein [Natronincola peptidivorans]SES76075.1 hypothetical protein SAMN05660297_00533 [Natronincola peptidivorans]
MMDYIRRYKKVMIIISIILLTIGSWYYLATRKIEEEPQKADLVFFINTWEDV